MKHVGKILDVDMVHDSNHGVLSTSAVKDKACQHLQLKELGIDKVNCPSSIHDEERKHMREEGVRASATKQTTDYIFKQIRLKQIKMRKLEFVSSWIVVEALKTNFSYS